MLKNLFKKKQPLEVINTHEADLALRLMFEIAISDGNLDKSELNLIKKRADQIATEDVKASTIVKKIIDDKMIDLTRRLTSKEAAKFLIYQLRLLTINVQMQKLPILRWVKKENLSTKTLKIIKNKRKISIDPLTSV